MRIVSIHEPPITRRETFGDRLQRLRLKRGWTQADLAERAYINDRTISRVETGRGETRAWVLAALAEALGVSMAYLWTGGRECDCDQ
jgi:transcriptional regulator with XRE-family HTH domain